MQELAPGLWRWTRRDVRSAERIWRHLGSQHDVAIHGHAGCTSRLEDTSGFRAVSGGETLADGIRAFSIGKPRRMEVPFELASHRALAVGDAIAEREVDRVLVTQGEPVLQRGARALAKSLDAPPWSRT
jgi:hypothetical protein